MSKELKHLPAALADVTFELDCPKCGKERTYKTKVSLERAREKKSVCASCRTSANNKKRIGTQQKEKNPAWKGYKHIPGKVFSKLKRDAATREISFDITIEDINDKYEQQDMRCALSGIPVLFGMNASVDRIDSDKGYTKITYKLFLVWLIS